MILIELAAGLVLLLVGGDALVRGAVVVATRLGVSPLVIGLTLVGFGTSMPELVASVQAAMLGAPGIAIGNVVGSNIANVLLILGISALVFPIAATHATLRRDGGVLIAASLVMVAIVLAGALERWVGVALIGLLIAFTIASFWLERRRGDGASAAATVPSGWPRSLPVALLLAVGGIVAVVLGAQFLVDAAIVLAERAGISQTVIGLTVVAVGTSLPELATSVVAAIRRQSDVALGNVIGSGIFNILGIAGVTGIVHPIPVPPEIARVDVWVMLAAAVLLVVFAATRGGVSRREGGILLACYAGYMAFQFLPAIRTALLL